MALNIPTPELDKLQSVREDSQKMGLFLESLSNMGLTLCEEAPDGYGLTTTDDNGDDYTTFIATRMSTEKILAMYFKIDLKKCEDERQALLDSIRA